LRRESRYCIGGGLGVIGITMATTGLTLALSSNDKLTPLIASIGVPVGLGILVAGLPAMILAPRFLGWYAKNGPAPSQMARLKLMNRWSVEELRVRRDTALIASAFFGAATGLTMAVWAGRDEANVNGVRGVNYDPGDAVIAMSFLGVTAATAASGVVWALQHKDAVSNKHRLFVMPTVAMGPEAAPRSLVQSLEGAPAPMGMAVRGALTFTF
jgi:F0F1-type ATP synthase membrane subunit c/vacuolar-type H+-ATPase subunit K